MNFPPAGTRWLSSSEYHLNFSKEIPALGKSDPTIVTLSKFTVIPCQYLTVFDLTDKSESKPGRPGFERNAAPSQHCQWELLYKKMTVSCFTARDIICILN